MPHTQATYQGCFLGLALGDALGAPYEGGFLERGLWRLLGSTPEGWPRWTDDTQMALDIAQSVLAMGALQQDDLAQRFAASYRWRRGYGPSTARLLQRIKRGQPWQQASTAIYPTGSYGNGAAMRAPIVALWAGTQTQSLLTATTLSAQVTHRHPLAIEGATIIALATQALLNDMAVPQVLDMLKQHCQQEIFKQQLNLADAWLSTSSVVSSEQIRAQLGNGMTAQSSVVSALYIALAHLTHPFEQLLACCRALRGDVDTISAMAGALWGAHRGVDDLPAMPIEQREQILALAAQLFAQAVP